MSPVVSIADADAAGVEVDVFGTAFNAVPITRSRQLAIEQLKAQILELDEMDPDATTKLVDLVASVIDEFVLPAGTRKKPAGDFIRERWAADKVTVEQVVNFERQLAEAVRPT